MRKDTILQKVAQQNNTTAEEVRSEIIHAMKAAMSNSNQDIQKKWASIPAAGEEPTPEELIEYIVNQIIPNTM